MNIAIIGYGRMGKTIEHFAVERGHEVTLKIDSKNTDQLTHANLDGIDVAIEFSRPETALQNLLICADSGTNAISGTTGWLSDYDQVCKEFEEADAAFLYASNFSIGVNLFFELNKKLAQLLSPHDQYKASIDEIHHVHKLDAPSGTAITIAEGLIANHPAYHKWVDGPPNSSTELPIVSHREGEVFGIHLTNYLSSEDIIQIKHEARSRKGFALGAVIAAEFIHQKKGIFNMQDVLGL